MIKAKKNTLLLTQHPEESISLPLIWNSTPAMPPFHGFFLPSEDIKELFFWLEKIPFPSWKNVLLSANEKGLVVFLKEGDFYENSFSFPLKRSSQYPFFFHVAWGKLQSGVDLTLTQEKKEYFLALLDQGEVRFYSIKESECLTLSSLLVKENFSSENFTPSEQNEQNEQNEQSFSGEEKPLKEFPLFKQEALPLALSFSIHPSPHEKKSFLHRWRLKSDLPSQVDWKNFRECSSESLSGKDKVIQGITGFLKRQNQKFSKKKKKFFSKKRALPKSNFVRQSLWNSLSFFNFFFLRVFSQQAAMVERLIREFEKGNTELALRHSIALREKEVSQKKDSGTHLSPKKTKRETKFSLGDLQMESNLAELTPQMGLDENLFERLTLCYNNAAEDLIQEEKYQEAAFVYAHLLQDYSTAISVLEKVQLYLEAASLAQQKLLDNTLAAEILERGGYHLEAGEIYEQENHFSQAMELYEKHGFLAKVDSCLNRWVEFLYRGGMRVEAGDILFQYGEREKALRLYYAEMNTPFSDQKGKAAVRRMSILLENSPQNGEEYFQESFQCLNKEKKEAFYLYRSNWIIFFQDLEQEMEKNKSYPLDIFMRQKRDILLGILEEASLKEENNTQEEIFSLLCHSPKTISSFDPFLQPDLQKALFSLEHKSPIDFSQSKLTLLKMPHGFLLGKEKCWLFVSHLDDARKEIRLLEVSFSIRKISVQKCSFSSISSILGIITEEEDFILAHLYGEKIIPMSKITHHNFLAIDHCPSPNAFFLSTRDKKILEIVWAPGQLSSLDVSTFSYSLFFLSYWPRGNILLGQGHFTHLQAWRPFENISRRDRVMRLKHLTKDFRLEEKKFPDLEFTSFSFFDNFALFLGPEKELRLFQVDLPEKAGQILVNFPTENLTSALICGNKEHLLDEGEKEEKGEKWVIALGYETGRIVLGEFTFSSKKVLNFEQSHSLKTGLRRIDAFTVKEENLVALDQRYSYICLKWKEGLLYDRGSYASFFAFKK